MPYKTILVHLDTEGAAHVRIRLAARLAHDQGAHLIGCAPTGVSRFIDPDALAAAGPAVAARCLALRTDARTALATFEHVAREEGVDSREARLVDDDVDAAMRLQARYADLVVVGQSDPTLYRPPFPPDLPARLALGGGKPVLVVPRYGDHARPGGVAVVAWDGSRQATRAVTGALPLLRVARDVVVLVCGDVGAHAPALPDPGPALCAWLYRHGIAARAGRHLLPGDVGEALLSEAADRDARLLVMGAYGRPRLREMMLDGVTETIMRSMTVPVLFAHE